MALSGDPLVCLWDMDETGIKANRVNRGSAGSALDLHTETDGTAPGDGLLTISDARGGRAVKLGREPGSQGPSTYQHSYLESTPAAIPYTGAIPYISQAGEGYVWGARFKWVAPYDDEATGDTDTFLAIDNVIEGGATSRFRLYFGMDASTPTACRPGIFVQEHGAIQDLKADTTQTGSPADYPIEKDEWYTIAVKVWFNSTGIAYKVWLRKESDGTLYTYTYSGTDEAVSADGGIGNSYKWRLGNDYVSNVPDTIPFAFDMVFLYEDFATDAEIEQTVIDGISIPWSQPDYRRAATSIYSSVTNENGTFPMPRPLPIGATVARHPVNLLCQEARFRVEGWRPGRPWALRDADTIFDPAGPFGSHRARQGERPRLNLGVKRRPGRLPWGSCEDARDVIFTLDGTRRRRGFKVRRDTGDEYTTSANGFWSLRDYDRSLFRLYKAGTTLYAENGSGVDTVDTAWPSKEPIVGFTIAGRLVLLSTSKRGLWNGSLTSIGSLSIAAPGSISPSVTSGGTLSGTYRYAATWYDPLTGDESGPIVASSDVSPSTQRVRITLPASTAAPDDRFTQFRIYRTNNAGAAPDLFFTATVTATTSSTVYDDDGDADGTDAIGRVLTADETFKGYITSVLPEDFAIGVVHQERAFYAAGADNPERVYICEPNSPNRNFADQWVAVSGAVRGMASWGTRLVVWTDTTTEILESDWLRTSEAGLNVNRLVVSKEVGIYGPNACIAFDGNIAWVDRHGAWVLEGQTAREISRDIRDLFPHLDGNEAERIVGAWDHVSHSLVWTVPCAALQTDGTRMQTQLVMDLEQFGRWTIWGMEASWVGQFDDDRQGIGFGLIDHAGVFKELHTYEGDGAEGNESFTTEDDDGISSISGRVVTATGTPGWTTDALRGIQVVLRDVSTGILYRHLIVANTSTTFTTETDVSSNLAAADGYYIGGIAAFAAFAASDFGSPNRKVIRQIQYELADLTKTDLYL